MAKLKQHKIILIKGEILMGKVNFWSNTQSAFDAIVTKDIETLYIVDNQRIYKGDNLLNDVFYTTANLPAVGVKGKLYVKYDNVEDKAILCVWNGSSYNVISGDNSINPVTNVEFDPSTQKFTFTYLDDSETVVDLVLESVIKDVTYDPETHKVKFTLVNNSETEIDLSDLIDVYTTENTSTIQMTITDGKISGTVKISAKSNNIVTVENDGLFVDGSVFVRKNEAAAAGNVATWDASGNLIDSSYKVNNTFDGTKSAEIPTMAAVQDGINSALTWLS